MRISKSLSILFWIIIIQFSLSAGCALVPDRSDEFASDGDAESEQDSPEADGDQEEAVTKGDIRIATWNVYRFFDDICDSGDCGGDTYEPYVSSAAYQERIKNISEGITRIDADIILLQEVEKQRCLDDLASALSPRYPVVVLGETGWEASVDVGVLSRGTLVEVVRHQDQRIPLPDGGTTTFAREFLEVHLELDGSPVIVFSAHFKAKSNDDPDRRLAEARAAYEIVTEVAGSHREALIVLGGDLNDTPDSDPIDALEQGGRLRRVADTLPGAAAGTYEYHGMAEAIDHLFIAVGASGAYVEDTAFVVKDNGYYLDDSDHASLRADFVLP